MSLKKRLEMALSTKPKELRAGKQYLVYGYWNIQGYKGKPTYKVTSAYYEKAIVANRLNIDSDFRVIDYIELP